MQGVFKAANSVGLVVEPAARATMTTVRPTQIAPLAKRGALRIKQYAWMRITQHDVMHRLLEGADGVPGGVLSVENFPALGFFGEVHRGCLPFEHAQSILRDTVACEGKGGVSAVRKVGVLVVGAQCKI